jgi:uncharacterized protein (DUF1778 family)
MTRQAAKSARFDGRGPPEVIETIKRAAEIEGRSVSDFILGAAHEAAKRTISETQIIRVSVEDQRALYEAFIDPPEPGPGWQHAREAYRRLIRD